MHKRSPDNYMEKVSFLRQNYSPQIDVARTVFGPDQWIPYVYLSFSFKQLPYKNSTSDPLRSWLRATLPHSWTWTNAERINRIKDWKDSKPPAIISPFVDRLARFIVAVTGGLSLVVPMIIMRLHQNVNKSLIVTSVAVVLFSAVVSLFFKVSNADTLGITAAYAAVLVVFVGTSS